MTVERLIAPERALPSHTVQEPRALLPKTREVKGGGFNGGGAGHKNYGQTIAHLFERRQDIRTSRYRDVPAGGFSGTVTLRADKIGAVNLRFGGGMVSVLFQLPPSIPESQASTRTRQWSVRVRTYYAADTMLYWPANVIPAWGVGIVEPAVPGDPPTIEEIARLPGQPGLAGTGDTFELTYDERTGEWIVDWISRGRAVADPATQVPGTTDPNAPGAEDGLTPTQPGEETPVDGEPEQDYTDPITGLPMEAAQMPAGAGSIIALHSGSLSYSTNAGSTWRRLMGSPIAPLAISTILGEGAVVVGGDGVASFSPDLQSWLPRNLRNESELDVPIVNGDFETGDLTGWESFGAAAPKPINTQQPPQQAGSTYYLTRDWQNPTPQPFAVRQTVELPAAGEAAVDVTVDVYAAAGQEGVLRVSTGLTAAVPTGTRDFSGNTCYGFARAPDGELLDLVVVSGDMGVFDGSNGSSGTRVFELRRADGSVYDRPVFISIGDLDSHEQMRIPQGEVLAWFVRPGNTINASVTSGLRYFTTTADNQNGGILLKDGSFSIYFQTLASSISLNGTPLAGWLGQEVEVSTTEVGAWSVLRATIPEGEHTKITIELEGNGPTADVYFDNVRVAVRAERQDQARTVAPDYVTKRHVVATDGSLYQVRRGVATLLSSCPIAAEHIAVEGASIIAAAGSTVAVSWDDGQTWTEDDLGYSVSQVFAGTSAAIINVGGDPTGLLIAFGGDGQALIFERAVGAPTFSGIAQPDSHLAIDRRRQTIVLTESNGEVTASGLDTFFQPVSVGATGRRTLACDGGRWIGWQYGVRDLFYTDSPSTPWALAPSLTAAIRDLVEVR